MKEMIYYPGFEIMDENWLKFALLYFDVLHPIMPDSLDQKEMCLSKKFQIVMDETDLIDRYSPSYEHKACAFRRTYEEIKKYLEDPKIYNIYFPVKNNENIIEKWKNKNNQNFILFREKYSQNFFEFCIKSKLGEKCDEWIKISYDIAESDIERINSGAGEKWVRVSDETIDALDKIISVSKKSKGTLDPTVLPLVSLWGLDCNTVKYPQKALIEKTLANVDYRDIKLNYEVKRVKIGNKNGAITLKQIEKGVACNKAIEIYKNMKVDYGVVSIGGTVGVYGEKPDSSLWKIAVKAPFALDKEDSRIAHIKIKEGYVATFGLKEDKINMNGAFKNKILDLRNGYPVENDIELVSVLHPDAIVASALAQICCVLNKEESLIYKILKLDSDLNIEIQTDDFS